MTQLYVIHWNIKIKRYACTSIEKLQKHVHVCVYIELTEGVCVYEKNIENKTCIQCDLQIIKI